jgi:hypothetical protein
LKPNDRDRRLVDFLKQHQPSPPPADPQLEARLFAEIRATEAIEGIQRRRRWSWLGAAAAIAVPLAGMVYRSLVTPQPSAAELAQIAEFVESSWYCSASRCETGVWEVATDNTSSSSGVDQPALDSRTPSNSGL